jgi:hypothetical protein
MGDLAPVLEQVSTLMQEVASELNKANTGPETVASEGIIIELLVPPGEKSNSESTQPSPIAMMQERMRQMMQQMTRGVTAGFNNSKTSSNLTGGAAQGAAQRDKSNARSVEKSGGAANAGEWPEEFREALQSYFQAIEAQKK